ncbi:MAG: VF530 family protein [bacterium]
MPTQPSNPLQGKTLETILVFLVDMYGWEEMSRRIRINCFANDPSIKSSLTFLRRTPWARNKVEQLYIKSVG